MKYKVLITGASGYIGGALVDRLASKQTAWQVVGSVRKALEAPLDNVEYFVTGDLAGEVDWSRALQGVDVVVHTAGRAHNLLAGETEDQFDRINVGATQSLLEAAASAGVKRFIFLSSIGVLGERHAVPVTESAAPAPTQAYGRSKLRAEQAVQAFCTEHSIEYVIVRPTLVYSAAAPGNFRRLLGLVARGWPLPFKGLSGQRSFVALDNVCQFLVLLLQHPAAANEIYHLCDDEPLTLPALLTILSEGMGKRCRLFAIPDAIPYVLARVSGRIRLYNQLYGSFVVSNHKAKQQLGWHMEVDPQQALHRAAEQFIQS